MRGMACLLLGFTAGCSVIDPGLIEVDGSVDATTRDTGDQDAVVDAGMPDVPTGLRKPPPRPDVADGADVDPMTVALRDVVLNQNGLRWRDIGLDLDDLDTQMTTDEVECVPPNEDAEIELDGMQGIDNAFGDKLYPIVALALPTLEADARTNQEAGLGTIVMQMRGWNGTANDPRVDIFLTQSAAGTTADPETVTFDGFDPMVGGAAAPMPAWEGDDYWFGRDETFFMRRRRPATHPGRQRLHRRRLRGDAPSRSHRHSLLRGHGHGGSGAADRRGLRSASSTRTSRASSPRPWLAAGRSSTCSRPARTSNICIGSVERMIIENQLDTIADVRSRPGTGGPGVPCDAISVGVSFTGVRANWGGLGPSRPLPNPCD